MLAAASTLYRFAKVRERLPPMRTENLHLAQFGNIGMHIQSNQEQSKCAYV